MDLDISTLVGQGLLQGHSKGDGHAILVVCYPNCQENMP
jgi:hypothetical protein